MAVEDLQVTLDGASGQILDIEASGIVTVDHPATIRGSGLTETQIKALSNVPANSMYIDNNGHMWLCKRTIGTAADAAAWIQVNIEVDLSDIGNLANLVTTAKGNLVAAINEVDGNTDALSTALSTETMRAKGVEGTLSSLETDAKGNLVSAINEVNDNIEIIASSIASVSEIEDYIGGSGSTDYRTSIYYGKKLSILGDSASAFQGYVPEGYTYYYPAGNNQSGVLNVADIWWKKVMNALGMTLEKNNSWYGTTVADRSGEDSSAGVNRCTDLGSAPDVIMVFMGINDFFNAVPIGSYTGKTYLPAAKNTFREAYGNLIYSILGAYPDAELWLGTTAQTGYNSILNNVPVSDFNDAVIELAAAFKCKVLDVSKCGLKWQNSERYTIGDGDNIHPNKFGHSVIANYIIGEMDPAVRARYPIA